MGMDTDILVTDMDMIINTNTNMDRNMDMYYKYVSL
jgi:hypothetical protein